MICGVPIQIDTAGATSSTSLHDQAYKVLEEWRQYTEDWVSVAALHSEDESRSKN
ncbi:hypothetical protein PC129_g19707 [Phytophthora cactorum]|uniref:Uncharacterized protein n=1 Tax=Phytophthora cactorum TaxID=29920 RepID=A0A329RLU1_9STRA|nr:hypothetical protein Pcac1_g6645 [Phytophthora cactorum]KAG2798445.1 hypothetical protein PC111_g20850 [Phytophthora cactorum]KAG2798563.1 hypothetical protein PC112_g21294 [Phytophthora cactorum]KAG2829735.1 hypothetical protein PC113_g21242 [Phytophthora cactorum]KAG2877471.1 hypothetical protein PC114_g23615 [Phytophthora cactorum]